MLPRVLFLLVSLVAMKIGAEDRALPNYLMGPNLQQLLQARARWPDARSDMSDDYPDAGPSGPRRYLRATDLLKALSDKRNFITTIRQTRFKDSAYSPALTPSGRPYGTPLRWG